MTPEAAQALEAQRLRDQALAVLADTRMRDDLNRIATFGSNDSAHDRAIVGIVFHAVAAYVNLGGGKRG
jgi:hypothetical protein